MNEQTVDRDWRDIGDFLDEAQVVVDELQRSALRAHAERAAKQSRPRAEGYCHQCGVDVAPAQIFCGAECAQEYARDEEKAARIARIAGRG